MTPRTLKEVAQAGLVLGFEWIARDGNSLGCVIDEVYLYSEEPWRGACGHGFWYTEGEASHVMVQITDYPDLPPEQSLLRLRDIVEGAE